MYNETTEMNMTKRRRLHPASMLFEFSKIVKELIFGIGIGLIFALKESFFYFLLFVVIFVTLLIIYSVLSWYRFTYHVENGELRIEQGVFVRKKRYLSIHRIHKIDLTANVIHRILKLVKVQIDSASNSDGAEVYLSAVKVEDAVRLRNQLKRKTPEQEAEKVVELPQKQISWKNLFIAGSTSGSAGIVVLFVLTIFTQFEELIPRTIFNQAYQWVTDLTITLFVILVLLLLFVLWVFGIAGTMIRYGNFTIEKRKDELFIKRGLLETKELTIPFDRIQAIGIEQSIIRQPFGYVRIFAVVAGGSFDTLESFPVLFPLMRERDIEGFIKQFIPAYENKSEQPLKNIPRRSVWFYITQLALLPLIAFIPVVIFFPTYSWIPLIILILAIYHGYRQYKDAGFTIEDRFIVVQFRRIQKTKIITSKQRIQAFQKKQHKIQDFFNLATIYISLIGISGFGTHYALSQLTDADANEIANWYSYRA